MDSKVPTNGGLREASPRDEGAVGSGTRKGDGVPSPMSRVLTVADLPALMRVLGDAAHCTYHLGTQLGLDPHLVRTLKQQAPDDLPKFLSLVLERRIKHVTPPPTLQVICDALSEPPIKDEDLAWRLQQYFSNSTCPHQLLMGNSALSHEMAAFCEYLDAVYENAPIPFDPKGGPNASNCYIKLAVVRKEEVSLEDPDEFMKAIVHGTINQIMNKKEAIELKDVFVPDNGQKKVKFVMVEGAPGIGKSTLSWELCRRRHEVEAMRRFSAVVYLSLREKEVQEAKSLADLLYHDNPRIQLAVTDEITSKGGEDILLILDGFDEVPAYLRRQGFFRKSSYLAKVICGKQLPKATILVTSRPSARADLLSLRKPCKHIEVLGFTDELIEQYVSSVYGSNPSLVADFFKYISTNPSIKGMMHVPLNSAIVVEIYQETRKAGKPIPQTMTQLYSELTLSRMSRHLAANYDQSVELPEKLECLHREVPEVYDQLLSLAKLAFEGTLKQEVIFDRLPAGCSTLGLMTTIQNLHGRSKHSTHAFLHLTVQEFLSAFHVSSLPGTEQKKLFSDMSKSDHVEIVWRFLAGLTGFRDIGWKFVQSTRASRSNKVSQALVQYLYEAQEKADFVSVLGGSKVTYGPWSSYSALDCFALGYCIVASRCSWEVVFTDRNVILSRDSGLGPELVEMLLCGLNTKEGVSGSIDTLDLSGNPIRWEGLTYLGKMPRIVLQQLSCLCVGCCELDGQALDVLSDIIPNMTSLECLDISSNEFGLHASHPPEPRGGMDKLFQLLAKTTQLHTLRVDNTGMSPADIMALLRLIEARNLRKLSVGENTDPYNYDELLLETVLSPTSLKHLDVHLNQTTSTFEALKVNRNLTTLIMYKSPKFRHSDPHPSKKEIQVINDALQHNRTLKYLEVPPRSESMFSVKEIRALDPRTNLYMERRFTDRSIGMFLIFIAAAIVGLFWQALSLIFHHGYARHTCDVLFYGIYTFLCAFWCLLFLLNLHYYYFIKPAN